MHKIKKTYYNKPSNFTSCTNSQPIDAFRSVHVKNAFTVKSKYLCVVSETAHPYTSCREAFTVRISHSDRKQISL